VVVELAVEETLEAISFRRILYHGMDGIFIHGRVKSWFLQRTEMPGEFSSRYFSSLAESKEAKINRRRLENEILRDHGCYGLLPFHAFGISFPPRNNWEPVVLPEMMSWSAYDVARGICPAAAIPMR